MYQKVVVSKEEDAPMKIQYEVVKTIDNSEYEDLLNKFTPNYEFSLVDKMIQELSTDIIPSFKKSSLFTNEDLENIVRPFKKDYIVDKRSKKKPSKYFNKKSRKNDKRRRPKRSRPKKVKNKTTRRQSGPSPSSLKRQNRRNNKK